MRSFKNAIREAFIDNFIMHSKWILLLENLLSLYLSWGESWFILRFIFFKLLFGYPIILPILFLKYYLTASQFRPSFSWIVGKRFIACPFDLLLISKWLLRQRSFASVDGEVLIYQQSRLRYVGFLEIENRLSNQFQILTKYCMTHILKEQPKLKSITTMDFDFHMQMLSAASYLEEKELEYREDLLNDVVARQQHLQIERYAYMDNEMTCYFWKEIDDELYRRHMDATEVAFIAEKRRQNNHGIIPLDLEFTRYDLLPFIDNRLFNYYSEIDKYLHFNRTMLLKKFYLEDAILKQIRDVQTSELDMEFQEFHNYMLVCNNYLFEKRQKFLQSLFVHKWLQKRSVWHSQAKSISELNHERHQRVCNITRYPQSFVRITRDLQVKKKVNRLLKKQKARDRMNFVMQGLFDSLLPELKLGPNEEMSRLLTEFIQSVGETTKVIDKGIDIKHSIPLVNNFLDKLPETVTDKRTVLVIVCVILYFLKQEFNHPVITMALYGVGLYLTFVFANDLRLTQLVRIFLSDESQPSMGWKPQGVCDSPSIKMITTAMMSYLYYSAFNKCGDSVIEDFWNNTKNMKRISENMDFTFEFFSNIINQFLMFLSEKLGVPGFKFGGSSPFPELDLLEEEVPKAVRSFANGDLEFNYDSAQIIFALDYRLDMLIPTIPKDSHHSPYLRTALYLKQAIKPILDLLANNNVVNNGPRATPWSSTFAGGTKVGKSTLTPVFIVELLTRVMTDLELEKFKRSQNDSICYMNKTDEYMSNYHGQYVFVIDEFLQNVDTIGLENFELYVAFDGVNCKNFNISGASLAEKGRKNFTSRAVIMNTNRTNLLEIKSIIEVKALARRMGRVWWVTVKPEYSVDPNADIDTRQVCPVKAKLAPMKGGFNYSMDIYLFYKYNINHQSTQDRFISTEPLDWDQLIEFCAVDFLQHHMDQKDFLHLIQNCYKSGLEERDAFRNKYKEFIPQNGEKSLSLFREFHIFDTAKRNNFNYEKFREQCFSAQFNSEVKDFLQAIADAENKFRSVVTGTINQCFVFLEKIKDVSFRYPIIPSLLGLLSIAGGVYFLTQKYFRSQAGDYPLKQRNLQKMKAKSRPTKTFSKDFRTQGALLTENHTQVINKIVTRNIYAWRIHGYKRTGYFLFLRERMAISPHHFYWMLESHYESHPDMKIDVWNVSAPESVSSYYYRDIDSVVPDDKYNAEDLTVTGDKRYWYFPSGFANCPDITKFIPIATDPIVLSKFYGGLIYPHRENLFSVCSDIIVPVKDFKYDGIVCPLMYCHPLKTVEGDCGLPLVMTDVRVSKLYICGIHAAGNGESGSATALDLSEIIDAFDYFKAVYNVSSASHPLTESEINPIQEFEKINIAQVGGLPDNLIPLPSVVPNLKMPSISKIKKTDLHSKLAPAECIPAKLKPFIRDGEIIDPIALARQKVSLSRPALNLDLLDAAVEMVWSKVVAGSRSDPTKPPCIWTNEEAAAGKPGYGKGVPRSTSLCFPWNLYLKDGKKEMLGYEGDYEFTSEHWINMVKQIEHDEQLILNGELPYYYFTSYLKDERRPYDKVMDGKTRLFNGCPASLTFLVRKYYGAFFSWLEDNKILNGIGVGTNPFGSDWGLTAKVLQAAGDYNCFGDISNFDGSTHPEVQTRVFDLAEQYYYNSTEQDRMIRQALKDVIIHSIHIGVFNENIKMDEIEGKLTWDEVTKTYIYNGGMVSGLPGTAHLNSLNNQVTITYVEMSHLVEPETFTLKERGKLEPIRKIVNQTFGDDSVISIPLELTKVISQTTLTTKFQLVGMKYTPEDKSDTQYTHRKLVEGTYLKRHFRIHDLDGQWCGALVIETLLEMVMWTKKGAPPEAIPDTVNFCIKEFSAHPPSIWEQYVVPLIRECRELGIRVDFLFRKTAFAAYRSTTCEY